MPQYFMTRSMTPLPVVRGVIHPLSMGDDTPLQPVPLSFNFPFYQPTRYVWIDPNGALHMHSSTPPCCDYTPTPSPLNALPSTLGCSFERPAQVTSPNGTVCTFDTSVAYTDIIAPSLLDLDPSSIVGSVRYVDSGSALLVQWVGVPWWVYGSGGGSGSGGGGSGGSVFPVVYYSFDVLLSIDGTILFHYTSVHDPTNDSEVIDPSLPPITRSWLVTVRQERWRDTQLTNAADYSTNRTGLYPPKNWVTNGSTITFCPVDTQFCMWPTDATLAGTTLVVLGSVNMTCARVWNHTYTLQFTLPSGRVASVATVYDASTNTLQALTPAVSASEAGVANVTLVDVTANTTVQFANPLYLTFHTSGTFNRTTIARYCTACSAYNRYFCTTDCADVYSGTSVIDACGQCSTPATYNSLVNCAGTCGLYTTNWTVTQCLCEQLQYPPVINGWVPGTDRAGQYVGTVSYWVQRGVFDVSACGVASATDNVYATLDTLDAYQSLLLAATSLFLALTLTHLVSARCFHKPLLPNPFDPSLYLSSQPPAVVVEAGGEVAEVRQEDGVIVMNEAAVEDGVNALRQEREARDAARLAMDEGRAEEEAKEDGMYLSASELWRRRQVQLTAGREQLTPPEEEHHDRDQRTDINDEKESEPQPPAAPKDEAVVQSVDNVTQSAPDAPAGSSSTFVPPKASPFAARRR